MAHDLFRDMTGKDCMFVVGTREDAWHKLGQRCDNAVTWEQAMSLAGLDWQVAKTQNYAYHATFLLFMRGDRRWHSGLATP
jgi:hypothetical protein